MEKFKKDSTASEEGLKPRTPSSHPPSFWAFLAAGRVCLGLSRSLSCLSFSAQQSANTGLAGQGQGPGLVYVCGRTGPSHCPGHKEQDRWDRPYPTRLHLHQPSYLCYLVYLEPPASRYEKVRVESPQEILQTNLKHFYVKFENIKYNQKNTSPFKKNLPYPLTLR